MSLLVCFSGQIGSGKSTVSSAVADALGWSRAGFGDYVRAEVQRMGGDPTSREALQNLGQKLVENNATKFCRAVLQFGGFSPGDNFVIDGVRHLTIYDALVGLAPPSTAKLLFLRAGELNRSLRVKVRADSADFARAETHRVESELRDDLPLRADAIIDSDRPLTDVVSDCLTAINNWLSAEGRTTT
jgi:cytidylate kinase